MGIYLNPGNEAFRISVNDDYDSERQSVFIPNDEVRGEFLRAVKKSG